MKFKQIFEIEFNTITKIAQIKWFYDLSEKIEMKPFPVEQIKNELDGEDIGFIVEYNEGILYLMTTNNPYINFQPIIVGELNDGVLTLKEQ